ncbi:MAG: DNA polymerase I, partial [Clostridiales Family XIII bacterium]|nr:DNA polymerase I [Clostridiales Family XIII bacterium]
MEKDNKRFIVIDGNSLINRAYYAIQRPMLTKEGISTQGIYGFLTMLNKLIADYPPAYIAVAFDRKAPTFRHKAYDAYKAGRKPMPSELAMQIPIMKDVLAALRIKILEIDGYEADDIIGTAAKRGEAAGLEPLIVTGDRDEFQLATDKTRVLFTRRGISEFDLYDAAAMEEKYGFSPAQFVDFKGLMGDASDNIPGLPGVGEKTASKLILEYGTVENLIERADAIANEKLRGKVRDNAQLAMMSKRLATIFTDVPIETDFSEMKYEEPDTEKLIELYVKLEFNSLLKKLNIVAKPDDAEEAKASDARLVAGRKTEIIRDESALREAMNRIGKADFVAFKTLGNNDHRNEPLIYGVNLMTDEAHYYIPVNDDALMLARFVRAVRDANVPFVGHNIQSDIFAVRSALKFMTDAEVLGADAGDAERLRDFDPMIVFDAAVAQYLADPTRSNYSVKTLAAEYFGADVPDEAEFFSAGEQIDMLSDDMPRYAEYGRLFCGATLSLKPILEEKLRASDLFPVYERAELPLIEPLAAMEAEGFAFDRDAIAEVG